LRLRVVETRKLRNIHNPEGDKRKGTWKKIGSKELHDLYFSLNFIRVIKS
jgi:hypothetical protein